MATTLDEILAELQAQAEQGVVYPVIIDLLDAVPVEIPFKPMLFSLIIVNDGPANIQYRVPNTSAGAWIDLNTTEIITFNFKKGVLGSVGFRKPAGATAHIRAIGSY